MEDSLLELQIYQKIKKLTDGHETRAFDVFVNQQKFREKYAWAIPSKVAIRELATYVNDDVLSVGAGTGLWEYLLDAKLMSTGSAHKITAIDNDSWNMKHRYFPVISADIYDDTSSEYVAAHIGKILMLVWPPFGPPEDSPVFTLELQKSGNMAATAVRKVKPARIIYVGEENGQTADDNFRLIMNIAYTEVTQISIPKWHRVIDRIFIYDRK